MNPDHLQESHEQSLNTIKNLQNQEKELYRALEISSTNPNATEMQRQEIINQIEKISEVRQQLYNNIKNKYMDVQTDVASNQQSLANEQLLVDTMENELNIAKANLKELKNVRNEDIRMAEINNYYSEKYNAQAYVMKTLVYFCVPILLLLVLVKKDLLPSNIAFILIAIILGFGIFIVGYQLIDLSNRSNMNYNQYNYPKNAGDLDVKNNIGDQPKKLDLGVTCMGQECCPPGNTQGVAWDKTMLKCVTQADLAKQTDKDNNKQESFVSSKLTQDAFDKTQENNAHFSKTNEVSGYNVQDNTFTTI